MTRVVEPEMLDELPREDPLAQGSRRDLRRLNKWMRSASKLASALERQFPAEKPRTIIELGAGDGTLLANVAQLLPPGWTDIEVTLIDKHEKLAPDAKELFGARKWNATMRNCDIFHWADEQFGPGEDVIVCNLFLHHFQADDLRELLSAVARRTSCFISLETLRNPANLFFSRLVGLIGCNEVTRNDARVSVRAGFRGKELSALWPKRGEWRLEEGNAGWFSQLFIARRSL